MYRVWLFDIQGSRWLLKKWTHFSLYEPKILTLVPSSRSQKFHYFERGFALYRYSVLSLVCLMPKHQTDFERNNIIFNIWIIQLLTLSPEPLTQEPQKLKRKKNQTRRNVKEIEGSKEVMLTDQESVRIPWMSNKMDSQEGLDSDHILQTVLAPPFPMVGP